MVENEAFLTSLGQLAKLASFVLSVCTGSALLAKVGLLDAKEATSNKLAFDWVTKSRSSGQLDETGTLGS
nr:hypothetical protein RJW52_03775 [Streptococcus suis]